MAYYDEELRRLQQQMSRKKRLESELMDLGTQQEELARRAEMLNERRLEEQEDVERLEGRSLAAFFYNVVGKMDEKLTKEREEAYAASVRYDVAARELEVVRTDIRRREQELQELAGCEKRYVQMLAVKADAVKHSGVPEAEEILQMEERISYVENQKKETGEAIRAGQRALTAVDAVLKELEDADSMGTLDLFTDGFLFDVLKYQHLDQAQSQVEQLQVELRRFKTELTDVTIRVDLQVNIDGFLRFADCFFDNLFTDWAVLDEIGRAQSQVNGTREQIEEVLARLDAILDSAQREQSRLKTELEELVLRASVN